AETREDLRPTHRKVGRLGGHGQRGSDHVRDFDRSLGRSSSGFYGADGAGGGEGGGAIKKIAAGCLVHTVPLTDAALLISGFCFPARDCARNSRCARSARRSSCPYKAACLPVCRLWCW